MAYMFMIWHTDDAIGAIDKQTGMSVGRGELKNCFPSKYVALKLDLEKSFENTETLLPMVKIQLLKYCESSPFASKKFVTSIGCWSF